MFLVAVISLLLSPTFDFGDLALVHHNLLMHDALIVEDSGLTSSGPSLPVQDTIAHATVTSYFKEGFSAGGSSAPITGLSISQLEHAGIASNRELATLVPGLSVPDYGSSMTSSIYVRGLGSRIDNPVVGLYLDDIPIMDKNAYDLAFLDLRRAEMYRGPNGTLYGRNSMVGVLSLETLSPLQFQGIRAAFEYGSANSLSARASLYKGHFGAAVNYRHSDGFYENEYDADDKMDRVDQLSLRLKYARMGRKAEIDNTLSLSLNDQGGYPYARWTEEDGLLPVNYNDESSYCRVWAMDGLRASFIGDGWKLSSMSSIQLLFDRMKLDQDFTSSSMFTLAQRQRQFSLTQELVFKMDRGPSWWTGQTGVFGFFKHNNLSAPVTFLSDGIDELILGNANANIPSSVGQVAIEDDAIKVDSKFLINTYNIAVYHESYLHFGRWLFTLGLRFDHEGNHMDYDSHATLSYKFDSPYFSSDYSALNTVCEGELRNSYFQILPKFSVQYEIPTGEGADAKIYALVSKGYTSGGFNTQIFSDIMQNEMMLGMMDGLGVSIEGLDSGVEPEDITYKPETCVNYELGGEFDLYRGEHRLHIAATFYHIDARNQQITVFPTGSTTGRMMANAGKSRSTGCEGELQWSWKGWTLRLVSSIVDARFVEYNDGSEDYSGNDIPYSPASTLYGSLAHCFAFSNSFLRSLICQVDCERTGHISWNEAGTIAQHPYALLGAGLSLEFPLFTLYFRGQNLTDTLYRTFYFKSVNNSFFQSGKPRRFTIGVSMDL